MAIVAVTASGLKLLRKAVCERICQKNFVRSMPPLWTHLAEDASGGLR